MQAVKQVTSFLFTEKCQDKYFVEMDFLDADCFKATLSKFLGLGIILGSLLVKLPQIIKIYKNKSGAGISLFSVTLDLTAITITVAYNCASRFPFSAWGDGSFLAIETLIIAILVLYYAGQTVKATTYLVTYLIILFILMSSLTPMKVLWVLQGFNIPILVAAKLSQALLNYKNGNTGNLSAITIFMLFSGSAARIFTSIQETGDNMMIVTYIVSTLLNFVILAQIIYYWNVKPKAD